MSLSLIDRVSASLIHSMERHSQCVNFEWCHRWVYSRVGKVKKLSNLTLIKVYSYSLKTTKNFVWSKSGFHAYDFQALQNPLKKGYLCLKLCVLSSNMPSLTWERLRDTSRNHSDKKKDVLVNTNAFKIKCCDRDLWSKMLIFKREFHKLRVLPYLCWPQTFLQLLRAFKCGNMYGFFSKGMQTVRGKS